MRHLLIALFAVLTCTKCLATEQPQFNAHDLSISWQAVENDKPVRGQSINAITITNNGHTTFPATGWKMYFNSARLITPAAVSGNATFGFVNGD